MVNRKTATLKAKERELIAELMKDSHRSDRELAKTLGVSQPTVSRMIKRLEKEGYIKEYTIIPDFSKIGFQLLGLIFVKMKKSLSQEEYSKAETIARQKLEQNHFHIVMLERGLGMGYDGVIITFYKDYSDFTEHMGKLKEFPFFESAETQSFLIDLHDEAHYLPLGFRHIGNLLIKPIEKTSE
ncbi:winged helix-turn-helix transcriptional regulator [Candidatus Bathyarchaeota archaeon]|nr:winged helix-turn-helix transcriptional regulator [Candidatus Bathyarchaeota archaeon]